MSTRFFASRTTRGFYDTVNHDVMPADVVEVSEAFKQELLDGERAGLIIEWDDTGCPFLAERPANTFEQVAAIERVWRDGAMGISEWLVLRHRDERDMELATTLSTVQFAELLHYRQTLRDWPQSQNFPDVELRPTAPLWLAEHIQ